MTTPKLCPPSSLKNTILQSYQGSSGVIDWELVKQYIPLLKSIVHRMRLYFPDHVETTDLYSLGMTGLVRAATRFDSTQSPHFGSYASHRIKGALLDELRRMDFLNRSDRLMAKELQLAVSQLEQSLKRLPTEEEVADYLKITVSEYQGHLDRLRPLAFISLDYTFSEEEEPARDKMLHDVNSPDARQNCERTEILELLKNRLHELDENSKKVILLYYYKNLKLSEIAETLNLTPSRVCQIHTQAILSLKDYFERLSKLEKTF